jgi:hypothetical protein
MRPARLRRRTRTDHDRSRSLATVTVTSYLIGSSVMPDTISPVSDIPPGSVNVRAEDEALTRAFCRSADSVPPLAEDDRDRSPGCRPSGRLGQERRYHPVRRRACAPDPACLPADRRPAAVGHPLGQLSIQYPFGQAGMTHRDKRKAHRRIKPSRRFGALEWGIRAMPSARISPGSGTGCLAAYPDRAVLQVNVAALGVVRAVADPGDLPGPDPFSRGPQPVA